MPKLTISLLGNPSITLDQTPLDAQTYKATALLAYLAINQQPHSRLELATLLWTDLDKEKALAALRTTLWKLKRTGIKQWLQINRDTVSLVNSPDIQIDITHFQDLIDQCKTHGHQPSKTCAACIPPLTEAVNLYRGDFMKGFSLRDAGEFDNWQSLTSEIFRQQVLQSLEKLVQGYRALGNIEQAIRFARRWVNYDHYNEEIHRQLMNLYVSTGQRTEALVHYRNLVKMLRRESLDPQAETTQLYHQILSQKTDRLLSSRELENPILLVVDIEHASELWANHHEQMQRYMNRYNAIVRECAQQFGGHVIRQTGDTTAIFFNSGLPVHCALTIYRRWTRTTWAESTIPRMRMALYAAEHRHLNLDDYSTDIFRALQLLNTGWGGQILLTTRVLNSVDLPKLTSALDLGIHHLKDFREPLRIYRLIHPDLPSQAYPPLQTLSHYRHNLPDYPTAFIDRQVEQADLSKLLSNANCRLLTLIGPGGVGKTRLALQVAAQQVDQFKDGIFFIFVAVPKTPDLLPALLAETFKFHFFELKEPTELIKDYLREKNILLIIDNFEHLVEGAMFLSNLLENAPGLKIIVTSRERLNLREEWIYEVQGMLVPPLGATSSADQYGAVQLFINNARRMLPGFEPSSQDLEAITRICNIVDGIPLAIELATAWIRTLSCQEIAREIEHNLDFLSSSMRDIPSRHRSLRAVFEHSWSLLSEEERRTFRRLAVFRGGFTADAALKVAKATPLLIASFVNRSLIRYLPQGRYEIIEVLRHFAENKLIENPEDESNTRALHCAYFADMLERNFLVLIGPDQNHAINEIRNDLENIRMAWNHAIISENWVCLEKSLYGLMAYKEILGHNREELEMFQAALRKLSIISIPDLERIKANFQSRTAWMAFCLGEHTEGLQGLQSALDSFTKLGLQKETATTLYMLAKANARLDHNTLAIEQINGCIAILRDERYAQRREVQCLLANALAVYGPVLIKVSRVNEAKQVLQESFQINQQLGTRFGLIHVIEALGRVQHSEGDLAGAQKLRLQALELAKEIGNKHSIAIILNNISDNYVILREYEKAIYYQRQSIELSREIGYRWLIALGLNNLAFLSLKYNNNCDEAIKLYEESLALFRDINDQRGVIFTLHDMGAAALHAGQVEKSYNYLTRALEKALQVNPEISLYVLSGFALAYEYNNQLPMAYKLCHLIINHPQTNQKTKKIASSLMQKIEAVLPGIAQQNLTSSSQSITLDQTISYLLSQN